MVVDCLGDALEVGGVEDCGVDEVGYEEGVGGCGGC